MHNAHVYMYYYSKNDHLDPVVIKAANACMSINRTNNKAHVCKIYHITIKNTLSYCM